MPLAPHSAADPGRTLREQGFEVLERLWSDAEVDAIRAVLERRVGEIAPPTMWAERGTPVTDTTSVGPTGLAFYKLLHDCPELAGRVLKPELLASLRGAMGEVRLELLGGLVSDESRPRFTWHTHIGGIDDGDRERWPVPERQEGVVTLLYLDDIDDDTGVFLVYPRRVGEPTVAPYDPDSEPWEGQVEVRVPRGSVVAVEECTWHAFRATTRPGFRMAVTCYFRAAGAEPSAWADDTLVQHRDRDPLLRSVIPA